MQPCTYLHIFKAGGAWCDFTFSPKKFKSLNEILEGSFAMPMLSALALSIGVLAAVATYLFVSDVGGLGLQIWAAFIAWACFFHCGGGERGVLTTIICTAFGVIVGAAALHCNAVYNPGLDGALWAGICVGIGAAVIVLMSSIPLFSTIPASVYGFASIAAFALLKSGTDDLLSPTIGNPVVVIILSLIVGAIFGYISEKLAGMLAR